MEERASLCSPSFSWEIEKVREAPAPVRVACLPVVLALFVGEAPSLLLLLQSKPACMHGMPVFSDIS